MTEFYDIREARAEIARLRGLLDFCVQHLECGLVHHDKGEYHKSGEPCPVMARLYSALPDRESAPPAGEG